MKIGIETIHTAYNVGAMLQAYALQRSSQEMGHQAELVDLYSSLEEKQNRKRDWRPNLRKTINFIDGVVNPATRRRLRNFANFRERYLVRSPRYFTYRSLANNPPCYDLYMVGSDQVWNVTDTVKPEHFLQYAPAGAKKVSYAASFGAASFAPEKIALLSEFLAPFATIGVREKQALPIVEEAVGRNAVQALDPTFLLSASAWNELADAAANGARCDRMSPYAYTAQLDFSPAAQRFLTEFSRQSGLRIVEYSPRIVNPRKGVSTIHDAGPLEFMDWVRRSSFVITSSFHAMVFAIHFRKPFYVFPHANKRTSRLESLLDILGLRDRIVFEVPERIEPVDYARIEPIIEQETDQSRQFLRQLLDI